MSAPQQDGAGGLSAPDYSKLREYLITSVQRDLEALKPSLEQRQQTILNSLKETFLRTKLSLPDSTRKKLFQIRRDRFGQDHAAQHPIQFHPRKRANRDH